MEDLPSFGIDDEACGLARVGRICVKGQGPSVMDGDDAVGNLGNGLLPVGVSAVPYVVRQIGV